jgi:hypothetical protein
MSMKKMDWKLFNLRMRQYKRTLTLEQWKESDHRFAEFIECVQEISERAQKLDKLEQAINFIIEMFYRVGYETECEYNRRANNLMSGYPALAYYILKRMYPLTHQITLDDAILILDCMDREKHVSKAAEHVLSAQNKTTEEFELLF